MTAKKYNLKTYSLRKRKNLVKASDFAKIHRPFAQFSEFFNCLPNILAAKGLRELVDDIVRAHRNGKQVVFAFGGHVVKSGTSPVVIDLINRGIITAIVTHGAGAIHDYEISLIGETSEDVEESIKNGSFGMSRETSGAFAAACRRGAKNNCGLGRAMGEIIWKSQNKFASQSILAAAVKQNIPAAVLAAIGTDITHAHPGLRGEDLGKSSLIDFHKVIETVKKLQHGVWINAGSAVILPEVFLKAVSAARNLGARLTDFTTANMDMIQHYRPKMNVLGRPSPKGIALTGHHEIMLPLLRAAVVTRLCRFKD
ncbi:MAG: deoxyhypusine synthase family protein [Planctomycetes bacterium]|nr:deoxyhypusine synthase family protein [Planctomycetota bacterium]